MTKKDVLDRISDLFLDRQLLQIDLNEYQFHQREWHLNDTYVTLHAMQSEVERDTQYIEWWVYNQDYNKKTKKDYQGVSYELLPMERFPDGTDRCRFFRLAFDTGGWLSTHWQRDATDMDFHDLLPPPPDIHYPEPNRLEIFAPPMAYRSDFKDAMEYLGESANHSNTFLFRSKKETPHYILSLAQMRYWFVYPPGADVEMKTNIQIAGDTGKMDRSITLDAKQFLADEILPGRAVNIHFNSLWNPPPPKVVVDVTKPDISKSEARIEELEAMFESYMRTHPTGPQNYMMVSIVMGLSDEYYRLLEEFGEL